MNRSLSHHIASAALAGLLLLNAAMFVAMLAGIAPHPPGERGPFLAAVAALAVVGLLMLRGAPRVGAWLAILTALAAVPGVGLHKFWTEPAAVALAPLIVVGSACVVAALIAALRMLRT